MVRGVSRRVIVVKPEQPALFEQAIFLVRDYNGERRTVFLCLPDSAQAHCSSAPFGR